MRFDFASIALVAGITIGCIGDGRAQTTPWPAGQADLRPGVSDSRTSAPSLDDVGVERPAAGIDARLAAFSGRWAGWACPNFSGIPRACDIKIVVEQVNSSGGLLSYAYGQDGFAPYAMRRMVAKYEANELWGNLENRPGGPWISLRVRPDGNLDFFFAAPSRRITTSGVLSRLPN